MLRAVCVQTDLLQAGEAAQALVFQAKQQLGIYRPQAGMLFSSHPHDPNGAEQLLRSLHAHFPDIQLTFGTVTAGFTPQQGYLHDGYFLCLLSSSVLTVGVGMLPSLSGSHGQGSFPADFKRAVGQLQMPGPVGLCLAFPSYHQVDGAGLVREIQQVMGPDCLVFGGCTTDYWSEGTAFSPAGHGSYPISRMLHGLCRDGHVRVEADAMPFLLVSGKFEYQINHTCGWLDSGDRFRIELDGTTLLRIDDRDAFSFLYQMGHPLVTSGNYAEYPLWIHEPGKEAYQRDIFLDWDRRCIHTGFIHINPDAEVSFSFPDKETLLNEQRMVLGDLGSQYDLSLVVGCSSRVLALREDVRLEAMQLSSVLNHSPTLGVYMFGEIFPHQANGAVLHSATMATLSLRAVGLLPHQDGAEQTKLHFLQQLLAHKSQRIAELEKQLEFFESNRFSQENQFLRDSLGILLETSSKSVSALSELLESVFKAYYGDKPSPYPISRGKLIARLNPLRRSAGERFRPKR